MDNQQFFGLRARNLNTHDQTFCHTTSLRPEYAQDLLKLQFDARVLNEKFDLSTMKRADTALHKAEGNKSLTDIAYTVDIKPNELRALLSLLIVEHKSYQDKKAPLQIAQQVAAAYVSFKHVIPILFAQTRTAWLVGSRIRDEVRQILGLKELDTPYFLIETHMMTNERLLRGDLTAAAVWGTMKYRWELEEFDQKPEAGIKAVVLILKLLRRTYIDYRAEIFGIVGGYMQRLNRSLSLEHVGEIEQKHLQPGEEPVVHELIEFDAKKARKKGHKQGHKQGALEERHNMAQRMLKANKPMNEICEFTGLSEAEIIKL